MNTSIGIRLLKGVLAVGGVLSAVIAAPVLYAAGEKAAPPSEAGAPPAAAPQPSATDRFTLSVEGMKTSRDMEKVQKELKRIPGIVSSACNQGTGTCSVEIHPAKARKEDIATKITKLGFNASVKAEGKATVKEPMP